MKMMRDYYDLKMKTDALLLTDAFEQFKKICF